LAIDLGEAAAEKVVKAVTIHNRADCCSGKKGANLQSEGTGMMIWCVVEKGVR
jgi:hypothetical protein